MRILLTSMAAYAPPRGGSTYSNLAWLKDLGRRGHECRVVCAAPNHAGRVRVAERVEVVTAPMLARDTTPLRAEIESFQPDWVLVSSEDAGHQLLREAAASAPDRYVFIAHTPQFMPFGPESWSPDVTAAERVKRAAAVVAISRFMGGYVNEHLQVRAEVIHPPVYNPPSEPQTEPGLYLLMINPCAVKGLSIFLDLARALPQFPFAALPGWGTTAADRAALESLPNISLLEPAKNIGDILRHARVLLVPSLWIEGFGLVVMEAMLHGVPVIASDAGGLIESKQGTKGSIAIDPICRYLREFDELHMPVPVVPRQNIAPWIEAARALCNGDEWRKQSAASRDAALAFVSRLDAGAFERMLLRNQRPVLSAAKKELLQKLRARRH